MHAKLTAQSLVLQILSVSRGGAMPVRVLIEVAELFEITENNLRVTLARLLSRSLIARDERGEYRLAEGGHAVQSHVAEWVHLEERMVAWTGGWVGVHTAALERGDRSIVRRRLRALEFLGFRELVPHLWIRPDNLAGGTRDVRNRLRELGIEVEAPVFSMTDVDEDFAAQARTLWDTNEQRREYRELTRSIRAAIKRLSTLPQEEAMVETFLLGSRGLRLLAFDPLLPDAICPGAQRRALLAAMVPYDRQGRRLWSRFMRARNAPWFEKQARFPSFVPSFVPSFEMAAASRGPARGQVA